MTWWNCDSVLCAHSRGYFNLKNSFIGIHLLKSFNLRICQKDTTQHWQTCHFPLVFSLSDSFGHSRSFILFLKEILTSGMMACKSYNVVISPCNCAISRTAILLLIVHKYRFCKIKFIMSWLHFSFRSTPLERTVVRTVVRGKEGEGVRPTGPPPPPTTPTQRPPQLIGQKWGKEGFDIWLAKSWIKVA